MSEHLGYTASQDTPTRWWDRPRLRVLAALAVAFIALLALPGVARAEWSVVGDTVPAGQVIDNDVVATGTDVVIDGTINGDLIAAGTTVTVNGPVSGSVLAIGRTVTLNGEVGGSTYVAARTLNLGEAADVQHNVHFAGLLLDGRPGSRIGRDLVAGSLRGSISSQVGRALKGLILLMTFDGRVGDGAGEPGGARSPGRPLAGTGPILLGVGFGPGGGYALDRAAPALEFLAAGLAPDALARQVEGAPSRAPAGIPEWVVARLADLLILLLVGGLALWLRPAIVRRPAEWLGRKPLPALGYGLLALVLSANAVFVAIALGALLLVAGIWLISIALWVPALLLWGIGFSALVLAVSLLGLTILYGTKVIVADLVGSLILNRLAPRAMKYRILPLLLGLLLYVILRSVPVLGWMVEAAATLLGLGAIWLAVRHRRQPQAAVVEEQIPSQAAGAEEQIASQAAGVDEPAEPAPFPEPGVPVDDSEEILA
jgi:cytoskeletal protein CcmA (bactofilin family)